MFVDSPFLSLLSSSSLSFCSPPPPPPSLILPLFLSFPLFPFFSSSSSSFSFSLSYHGFSNFPLLLNLPIPSKFRFGNLHQRPPVEILQFCFTSPLPHILEASKSLGSLTPLLLSFSPSLSPSLGGADLKSQGRNLSFVGKRAKLSLT